MSDIDLLYEWENDRETWEVSNTITPYSKHVLKSYINSVTDIYTDKQLRLIIEVKPHREAIGAVDLFDCDFTNRRVGIGILIANAENRGKGFGTEVIEVMLTYCYNVLAMHQVYCNVLTHNLNSIALFEKFGFKKIGVKRDWRFYNGVFHDELIMQKINKNG